MAFNTLKVLDHSSYGMSKSQTTIVIIMILDLLIIVPLNVIYGLKFIYTLLDYYDEAYMITFLIISGISIIAALIALFDFMTSSFFGMSNCLSVFDLFWVIISTFQGTYISIFILLGGGFTMFKTEGNPWSSPGYQRDMVLTQNLKSFFDSVIYFILFVA